MYKALLQVLKPEAQKPRADEHIMPYEFPKIRGAFFGGPYTKDPTILGSSHIGTWLRNPGSLLGFFFGYESQYILGLQDHGFPTLTYEI